MDEISINLLGEVILSSTPKKYTRFGHQTKLKHWTKLIAKAFSTTWKHCVKNTYIHLPTFGMQMKQVCKQEGLTMWRSYIDMDHIMSLEWSPKPWNWWLFLSTLMLLGNQSQILIFSKDEKGKGTTLKNVNLHHNGHAW